MLREMLMSKGGRDFAIACIENTSGIVPERVRDPPYLPRYHRR